MMEEQFKGIFHDLQYTEEQLYETSFMNVRQVCEVYINELNKQLQTFTQKPAAEHVSVNGMMMAGQGAEKVSKENLMQLARKQQQMIEEEKLKQQFG